MYILSINLFIPTCTCTCTCTSTCMYRLLSQSLGAFVLSMKKILLYTVIYDYEKLQDFSLEFTFYNYMYVHIFC